MCTRFNMGDNIQELSEIFRLALRSPLAERFINRGERIITSGEIFPTNVVPVIASNKSGNDSAFPMRWGFRLQQKALVVNARAESAALKPTFREAWERHRCIIPAAWYYEWSHDTDENGKRKAAIKYVIQPRGLTLTWLAGLYRTEEGFPCFTVITRQASEDIRFIHDRMPLVMPKERIHDWISPENRAEDILPFAVTEMVAEKELNFQETV